NQYKTSIVIVMCFAVISTVFSIVGPKILGKATTKLFEGLIAWASGMELLTDFDYIRNCIIILVILYITSAVFSYVQGWIMSGISMKVTYQLRKDISEKINKMPLKYFDSRTHGEVLSRITNDVDTVSQTLNQSLTQIITSVTTVVGVLVMMLSISVLMTLVAFVIVPLSMGFVVLVIKYSQKFFKEQQEYLGHINGHVEETYSGHNVMQVFNGEEDSIEKFETYNNKLFGSAWKSQFLSGMMMPIMTFIGNLGYVAVCILGGYLAVKKTIDVGDIQAFIQYMRSFTQPMSQLATISNTLQSTAAAAERVFEFLAEEEEVPEAENPVKLEKVEGVVEFQNVHFGYNPEKIIINDFSATINRQY
ncbi:MAG: ABC-type multidrug transport system, ATPase and permease component, partial [Clostridia bacterium]|nr:ABC-type multidrug transport system, ATPase and permease component [Clostridia bacterium]